eukprot:10102550-Alexandrium_andersonii.AAC.1
MAAPALLNLLLVGLTASLSFRIVMRLSYVLDRLRRRRGTEALWRLLQLARRPCRLDAGVWG